MMMMNQNEADHISDKGFSDLVRQQFEIFWMNNSLGYDKNGKKIRTNKPRKKPKEFFEMKFGGKKK